MENDYYENKFTLINIFFYTPLKSPHTVLAMTDKK